MSKDVYFNTYINNHTACHSFSLQLVPSGPPRNLATVNVTSHSISLTWDPPTSTNQNGIIRTYIVSMTVLETEENIQLMSNTTQINLEMLHPYYTYSFGISAVTIGAGPPSSVYNVTTDEQGSLPFYIMANLHIYQSNLTHTSFNITPRT